MLMVSAKEFNRLSDQLVTVPFDPDSSEAKIDRLQILRNKAGSLLSTGWERDNSLTPSALRMAARHCCLPSLEALALGPPHTSRVAQEVTENVQMLSDHALSANIVPPMHSEGKLGQIVGELSEITILGLLWWSIANGYRDERSYIVPATRKKDGEPRIERRKRGIDLTLYGHHVKKQKVQVKTKSTRELYYPGIALITLQGLSNRRCFENFGLLRALAIGKHALLADAHGKADAILSKACEEGNAHRQASLQRQAA